MRQILVPHRKFSIIDYKPSDNILVLYDTYSCSTLLHFTQCLLCNLVVTLWAILSSPSNITVTVISTFIFVTCSIVITRPTATVSNICNKKSHFNKMVSMWNILFCNLTLGLPYRGCSWQDIHHHTEVCPKTITVCHSRTQRFCVVLKKDFYCRNNDQWNSLVCWVIQVIVVSRVGQPWPRLEDRVTERKAKRVCRVVEEGPRLSQP